MSSPTDETIADDVSTSAKRANVSRAFLYQEINAGRLRSLKVGRRRLIMRRHLEEWLEAHEVLS